MTDTIDTAAIRARADEDAKAKWILAGDLAQRYTAALKDRLMLLAELDRLRAELAQAKEDAVRLDFLDEMNRRLNARYGTYYGWKLILNHNVNRLMLDHLAVDLQDAEAHGLKSCRAAIDAERDRIRAPRAAAQKESADAPGTGGGE